MPRTQTPTIDRTGLTQAERFLLNLLANEPDRIFTHNEIAEHLWVHGISEARRTAGIDRLASSLRRKLRAQGDYITNAWGQGYKLNGGA